MNEKCGKILKEAINNLYSNIYLDELIITDDEFYYDFKTDDKVSENDFNKILDEMKRIDNDIFVKLLRISGVYYQGNINNEMINRISGKAFSNQIELDDYEAFLEDAKSRDHRKIGQDLDLFCFSDYVGPGLPLYTPRGTIIIDEFGRCQWGVCKYFCLRRHFGRGRLGGERQRVTPRSAGAGRGGASRRGAPAHILTVIPGARPT